LNLDIAARRREILLEARDTIAPVGGTPAGSPTRSLPQLSAGTFPRLLLWQALGEFRNHPL
jgi:hypothetical protein